MRGFALVELLVALVITSAIAAGIAAVVPPSREAFEHTPAALDAQQHGRSAVETITQAVRSAGLPGLVPPVALLDPDEERFAALRAIARRPHGAEGMLAVDQSGVSGALTLSHASCPDVADVCGFTRGATAVIADGAGRFDLFVIDATDEGAHGIVSDRPFSEGYAAGAVVMEVDAHTYRLAAQPDGSHTLVRETVAGAVQPIVDRIRGLNFSQAGARLDVSFVVEPAASGSASHPSGAAAHQFSVHMRNAS